MTTYTVTEDDVFESLKTQEFDYQHLWTDAPRVATAAGPWSGTAHTEETKQKIRDSGTLFVKGNVPWNKGKPGYSTKQKGTKGRAQTEETRKKISETVKGRPSNAKGKVFSPEARKRMSEGQKRRQEKAREITLQN